MRRIRKMKIVTGVRVMMTLWLSVRKIYIAKE